MYWDIQGWKLLSLLEKKLYEAVAGLCIDGGNPRPRSLSAVENIEDVKDFFAVSRNGKPKTHRSTQQIAMLEVQLFE